MEFLYPFGIAFFLVFVSELGDKTQLLVLSFSAKMKSYTILLGVALGSFFSHGLAILFGSVLGSLENESLHTVLKVITYVSFLLFGLFALLKSKDCQSDSGKKKGAFLQTLAGLNLGYLVMIALSIAIGELGDKTFLASLGLGIQYPNFKVSLILGAIAGMVVSDSLAIVLGKWLSHRISDRLMEVLSGIIFLIFGAFGILQFLLAFFS